MSYVALKQRLAELTLEAVADPKGAAWVPLLFVCAHVHHASLHGSGVAWNTLRVDANKLGESFGWVVSASALDHLVAIGLLVRKDGLIALPAAFGPYGDYLARQTLALLSFLSRYLDHTSPPRTTIPQALWQGVLLFNDGLYFECHELLEGAWKQATGPEKDFLHGIVQVAAAFYHYDKGNLHGARTLLTKAMRRLEKYPSPYREIDLADLQRSLARWRARFAEGSDAQAPAKPIIRFTTNWDELGVNY